MPAKTLSKTVEQKDEKRLVLRSPHIREHDSLTGRIAAIQFYLDSGALNADELDKLPTAIARQIIGYNLRHVREHLKLPSTFRGNFHNKHHFELCPTGVWEAVVYGEQQIDFGNAVTARVRIYLEAQLFEQSFGALVIELETTTRLPEKEPYKLKSGETLALRPFQPTPVEKKEIDELKNTIKLVTQMLVTFDRKKLKAFVKDGDRVTEKWLMETFAPLRKADEIRAKELRRVETQVEQVPVLP